jgi:hypothetical protein
MSRNGRCCRREKRLRAGNRLRIVRPSHGKRGIIFTVYCSVAYRAHGNFVDNSVVLNDSYEDLP